MATYFIGRETFHTKWDNSLPPAIEIDSGDVVVCETEEVTGGQITPASSAADLGNIDFDRIYPLAGPIYVRGAEPGDVLAVEILALRPLEWGWTGVLPTLGLLPDDFPEPALHIWDLTNLNYADFKPGIRIPLDPFCGTMGVAPAEPGQHFVLPPGKFGGNMDIRHLNAGNTLLLPVQVPGALFSAGDCHAAQGDGEVCVTGIECPMRFELRFTVHKGRSIQEPRFICRGPLNPKWEGGGYYATTSVGPDLFVGAQNAIRYMIDHLVHEYDLSPVEAYMLCSVAVDLKISEIVDAPNWIVSAYLPLGIFQ